MVTHRKALLQYLPGFIRWVYCFLEKDKNKRINISNLDKGLSDGHVTNLNSLQENTCQKSSRAQISFDPFSLTYPSNFIATGVEIYSHFSSTIPQCYLVTPY